METGSLFNPFSAWCACGFLKSVEELRDRCSAELELIFFEFSEFGNHLDNLPVNKNTRKCAETRVKFCWLMRKYRSSRSKRRNPKNWAPPRIPASGNLQSVFVSSKQQTSLFAKVLIIFTLTKLKMISFAFLLDFRHTALLPHTHLVCGLAAVFVQSLSKGSRRRKTFVLFNFQNPLRQPWRAWK